MNTRNNYLRGILIAVTVSFATSCKKDYLETKPSYAATEQTQLGSSVETITAALNGAEQELFAFAAEDISGGHDNYGQKSWDLSNDLMGDDMVVNAAGYGWYNRDYQYTEWQSANTGRRSDITWRRYYRIVAQMNTILKYINSIPNSTKEQRDAIAGQAKGMRAYAYFYLINSMQQTYAGNTTKPGVPVVTDSIVASGQGRGKVQDVYDQITRDLNDAESLLAGKTFADKAAFDIHVVQGFRARVELLKENWQVAANYAKAAYAGFTLLDAKQYKQGFSVIANNPEVMWGSIIAGPQVTFYASFFSHMDVKTGGYAALGQQKKITKYLYDKIPVGDVRKTVFQQAGTLTPSNGDYTSAIAGYTTPSSLSPLYNQLKFRVPTPGSWVADYIYMRASEMYLIAAEGLARSNNESEAKTILKTLVSKRFPTYDPSALSGSTLLDEILLQRRIELWGEGFRLMDIKRLKTGLNRLSGTGNHGVPNLDPIVFTLTDPAAKEFLMRIPQNELDTNPYLTANDQNP